jgi:hypothetical protein
MLLLAKVRANPSLKSAPCARLGPNRGPGITIRHRKFRHHRGNQTCRGTWTTRARGRSYAILPRVSAALSPRRVARRLSSALASNPNILHAAMLRCIAELEETIVKLPTPPGGPLDDNEIEDIRRTLAWLKTLPPVPTQLPVETVAIQSKLRTFGEKILSSIATDAATRVVLDHSVTLQSSAPASWRPWFKTPSCPTRPFATARQTA